MDAPGIMQRRNQHTPVQAQDSGSLSLTLNRKRGALPSRAGPFIPRTPAPSTLLVSPRLRGLPPPFTPPRRFGFSFPRTTAPCTGAPGCVAWLQQAAAGAHRGKGGERVTGVSTHPRAGWLAGSPRWAGAAPEVRPPQPPQAVVTPRSWGQMSVAQHRSLHTLGFTPRSWHARVEAKARVSDWAGLSDEQRDAARTLGWDVDTWELRWGSDAPPSDIVWKPLPVPPPPRISKLQAIKHPNHQRTHGLFSEQSYHTIGDPYRMGAESVERRKVVAASGVCHEALMTRARGKGFQHLGSGPRHGQTKDAYFSNHAYMEDRQQQRIKELSGHQAALCTDRAHGTHGMTAGQVQVHASLGTSSFVPTSTGAPHFAYSHVTHSTRT
jgi:hypothetical protein